MMEEASWKKKKAHFSSRWLVFFLNSWANLLEISQQFWHLLCQSVSQPCCILLVAQQRASKRAAGMFKTAPSLLTLLSKKMLNIPPYVLIFFSSGGENIKSINQQSGAHVELQRNPPPNTDPGVRIFTIRGVPQQIELARHLIDEKVGVSSISWSWSVFQTWCFHSRVHVGLDLQDGTEYMCLCYSPSEPFAC